MIALVSIAIPIISSHKKANFDSPPINLLYLGGALKRAGYEVEVYHIGPNEIEFYAKKIIKKNPLFVGFSSLTGIPVQKSAEMSRIIKRDSDIPIVWGGIHSTLLTKDTIKEDYVDIIVLGEGEITVVELANALKNKKDIKNIKGLVYKKKNKIYFTEPKQFIKNLDEFYPDWELIDINKYLLPITKYKKGIKIVTSRGCPYSCAFCYNRFFNKSTWRYHSVDYVIKQINMLRDNYGVEAITFLDDNFFANKNRAYEILEKIKMPWTGDLRINYVDDIFVKKMRESKCQAMFLGCESGSERILKLINKEITVKQTVEAIRKLKKVPEINIKASFIMGVPTETKEEINKTIELVLKLGRIHPNVYFNIGLYIPYPGTELYDLAIKEGFKPPQNTEEWSKYDIISGGFDATWLKGTAKKYSRNISLIHSYGKIYSGQIFGHYWGNSILVRLLKYIASKRIKKQMFSFPYDLKLIQKLRDLINEI